MPTHGKSVPPAQGGTTASPQEGVPRIYIVEDHPVVRAFLSQLVEAELGFSVAGMSEDARHALADVVRHRPDLVILDLSLSDGHGFELIKDIGALDRAPKVLVFSTHEEELYAERVLEAGALGYVRKTASPKELAEAIARVLAGQVYLSPQMTSKVLLRKVTPPRGEHQSPIQALSDRELQVFELIGRGQSTKQIAGNLGVDTKTIETYRARIKDKLGLSSAPALMRAAFQWVNHGSAPDGSL
jgi:DNA-binding NarL/FixJ family response regulator